jgi:ribose-phosphate pyrophosphokinase
MDVRIFPELRPAKAATRPLITPDELQEASPMIFSGTCCSELAGEIADCLGVSLGNITLARFSDGETFVKINENVRGRDTFIILSTCAPVNDNLMELLLIADALKRASARTICAVIPYFGYARQDRKDQGRVALSAKLVANMIVTAGYDRVVTVDLHTGQIQGFFDIPVDHLEAAPILCEYAERHFMPKQGEAVVVSPDIGSVKRAREHAEHLGLPLAIVDKRRPRPNVSEVMSIIGDIQGKDVLLFDDMIDTAGTLCTAAKALSERGAKSIVALATHAVLSGPAYDRIAESPINAVVVTNTIPPKRGRLEKLRYLSVAPLLAETIKRIYYRQSVSSLFK